MKSTNLSKILLLLLFATTSISVFAQWAGPDQEILRQQDNSQTVTLSVANANPNYCYVWSGPNIIGNTQQPTVTANPQQSTQTYTCRRFGDDGVAEDAVVVTLIDSVGIVSVKPLKNCYQNNDPISLSDFEIVTNPAGYENQVRLAPLIATKQPGGNAGKSEQTINFQLTVEGRTSNATAEINVIDPEASVSVSMAYGIKDYIELLRKTDDVVDEFEKLNNKLKDAHGLKAIAAAACSPDWDLSLSIPQVNDMKYGCCEDKLVEYAHFQWGGGTISFGVQCNFPTPLSVVPGVYVYLTCGVAAGYSVGSVDMLTTKEENCSQTEIGGSVTLSANGGVGIAALSPKILSAELVLEGSASTGVVWKVTKRKVEITPVVLTISVVGRTKCLGLFSNEVRAVLAKVSIPDA